jgi:hypothetical protein
MLTFLRLIPGRIWGYLAAGIAVLVAVWRIYAAGKSAARADGMAEQLGNVEKRNEVDRNTGRLPDGGAADRLREQWSRD